MLVLHSQPSCLPSFSLRLRKGNSCLSLATIDANEEHPLANEAMQGLKTSTTRQRPGTTSLLCPQGGSTMHCLKASKTRSEPLAVKTTRLRSAHFSTLPKLSAELMPTEHSQQWAGRGSTRMTAYAEKTDYANCNNGKPGLKRYKNWPETEWLKFKTRAHLLG